MKMKKYIKLIVLSLVLMMVFTGCRSQKIDDGGIDLEKERESNIDETNREDESEILDEEIMIIDIREMISSIFDGEFPFVVVSDDSEVIDVEKIMAFVIALDENPSTGYIWSVKKNDLVESIGDGFLDVKSEELLVGSGGTHYYGFKALETGKIEVEFELISPSGDVEERKTFTLNSK